MITKSKPARTIYLPQSIAPNGNVFNRISYAAGSETIVYSKGPKTRDGHLIWKTCEHRFGNQFTCDAYASEANHRGEEGTFYGLPPKPPRYLTMNGLSMPDVSSVYSDIWDQLDLNCHDSVLLYSGILQAVPLVGGCFRFVSVMNKLGKKIAKGLRKQPFTTVLKSAISLDFIDRFVVSPTIDDARKFINAHNYVMNVINTAYERSGQLPTAYQMSRSDTRTKVEGYSSYVYSWGDGFGGVRFRGTRTKKSGYTTKVSVLASTAYNTAAIDPIKLWASRLGITKPLDSAWDLVPFSFVIDYFSRAGDFISGIGERFADQDALRGRIQKVYGCWAMQSAVQEDSVHYTSAEGGSPITFFHPGTSCARSGTFRRYPINPLAEPVESPSGFFRLDLSSTRMRTLGELFVQGKLR